MNPITREKCLELAKDNGFFVSENKVVLFDIDWSDEIESLVRASVALGLEMAAEKCEEQFYASSAEVQIRKLAEEVQRG